MYKIILISDDFYDCKKKRDVAKDDLCKVLSKAF